MYRIIVFLITVLLAGQAWAFPKCPGGASVGPPNVETCYSYTLLDWPADGMLSYRGRKSPTFDRNSATVVTDHEGLLVPVSRNDEASFTGLRRVRNLLADDSSEDFSGASWAKGGTATVTGTNTLNFPADGGTDVVFQVYSATSPAYNRKFVFSVTLSGTGTIKIVVRRSGGTLQQTEKTVTLSSTPTRFTVSHTFTNADNTGAVVRILRDGTTATTVTATNAMLEEVTGQTP